MAAAIKAHNNMYGRGKRPDLFRKLLNPSFHLTQKEKDDEQQWVAYTDFICRRGRAHYFTPEQVRKFPKPFKEINVREASETEKFARKILARAKMASTRRKKGNWRQGYPTHTAQHQVKREPLK